VSPTSVLSRQSEDVWNAQAATKQLWLLLPMTTWLDAVVMTSGEHPVRPASLPMPMLLEPVVLEKSAALPEAVLEQPVVLEQSAPLPVTVLKLPVVLQASAFTPLAVF